MSLASHFRAWLSTVVGAAAGAATLAGSGGAAAESLTLTHDPFPPYVFADDTADAPRGLTTAIVITVLRRAGYDPSIDILPWARALQSTRDGDHDALLSAWYTDDRDRYLAFSRPIFMNRRSLLAASEQNRTAYADMTTTKTVTAVRGYKPTMMLQQRADLRFNHVSGLEIAVRMLNRGRTDFIVGEERVVAHTAGQIGIERPFAVMEVLQVNCAHVAVSRKHKTAPAVVADFNRIYEAMASDGSLQRLFKTRGVNYMPLPVDACR